MERNLASILALAGTAAISVTLAAMAPGDAYADDLCVDGTQAQYSHLPTADGGASVEELKTLYLKCDSATVAGRLSRSDAMLCSVIYEALKHQAFDGDFDRLLAWSRANTQRAGER
jgi:hypothetical protein